MRKQISLALISAAIAALGGVCFPAYADKSIPVADFFKKPQYGGAPILSPDGKNIAVLTPRNGHFVLAVINLESRQSKVIASDPDWDIGRPFWVNNSRLAFSVTRGSDVVMEDQDGGGLFAVNIDGTNFRKLLMTIKEAKTGQKAYKPFSVVKRVSNESNDLIVVNNERGNDAALGASDLFRLDTTTGRTKLLTFDNPGKVGSWVVDHDLVIRVASSNSVDPDNKRIKQTVYYRDGEGQPWKQIYQAYHDEGNTINPLTFDFDNKTLLVAGRFNGQDKEAIYTWDFAKQTAGEMIADHPVADLNGVIVDEKRKKIVGTLAEGMTAEMIYFDEDYAKIDATLKASFPGQQVNFSWSGNNIVVFVSGDQNVGKVYLYDIAKKSLEPIYSLKPELEGKKLSAQQVFNYTARDGLNIPAYLTLPEGVPAKNLPLVAYVHGGPHARDSQGFDPLLQLMASRGYAVLQPQFRMSTGFGWKHHTAGWKQWGLAMQDDVSDGVQHLIKQGIVDKNRVCIIGASYGGYATMYGLIKDPDQYKCGINWVGVTDVKMLFTVTWSDMKGPVMDNIGAKMHGDPKTDGEYFKKVSAIDNAHKIKASVLMAYGSEDIRVPLIHGEKMRDKLKAQGNEVEWMVFTGEGHGWVKESNRILWGETVVRFLDKYIGKNP